VTFADGQVWLTTYDEDNSILLIPEEYVPERIH
jgi:hypothetical protein